VLALAVAHLIVLAVTLAANKAALSQFSVHGRAPLEATDKGSE